MKPNLVGPVLSSGELASAVTEAIRRENDGVDVVDRGAYLRVSRADSLSVSRVAIESCLGRPFRLPIDLEAIMPSFRGAIRITSEEVTWRWRA